MRFAEKKIKNPHSCKVAAEAFLFNQLITTKSSDW